MFEFAKRAVANVTARTADLFRGWGTAPSDVDVDDYISRRPAREEKLKQSPGIRMPYFMPYMDATQTAGETVEHRQAYRQMLADPDVKAAWVNKLFGVMSLDLNIRPYKKKHPRHQLIADFVKWNLTTRLYEGMPGLVWDVLSGAMVDGWSLCEPTWTTQDAGEYRGKLVLRRIKAKDVTHDLVPLVDEHRNIVAIRGLRYNDGTEYSPRDFLIYTHMGLFENPVGMSDFRAAYASWWFLDTITKLRAMGADRRALPIVMGEYPDITKQSSLEDALAAIKYRNWIAVPKDVKLQAIDMAGRADEIFASFTRDLRERIWIGLDGATLQSMQSAAGAVRGNSEVHKDTADLRKWYLSTAVSHILNDYENGLIRQMVDANYVGAEGYPVASLGGVDDSENKETLSIAQGLQQMGWVHSREAIEDRFGWPWGEGEDALHAPQEGMGGMGMGAGMPGGMPGMPGMPGMDGGPGGPAGGQPDDPQTQAAKADGIADILGGLYGNHAVDALAGAPGQDDGGSGDSRDGDEQGAEQGEERDGAGSSGQVSKYAEEDWVHAPGPRSQNRWRQLRTGRVEYSVENPGKHEGRKLPAETKDKRPQVRSDAEALIQQIKADPATHRTPENAQKLVDHLGKLTVAEIHDIKRQYGLKASGSWKSLLVQKVAERLQYGMPPRATKNRSDRWGSAGATSGTPAGATSADQAAATATGESGPSLPPEVVNHLHNHARNLDAKIAEETKKLNEDIANATANGIKLPDDIKPAAGGDAKPTAGAGEPVSTNGGSDRGSDQATPAGDRTAQEGAGQASTVPGKGSGDRDDDGRGRSSAGAGTAPAGAASAGVNQGQDEIPHPEQRSVEGMHPMAVDALNRAKGLSADQHSQYGESASKVLAAMPEAAHARMKGSLRGLNFHADANAMAEGVVADIKNDPKHEPWMDQEADAFAKAVKGGAVLGGVYNTSTGNIHLDGGVNTPIFQGKYGGTGENGAGVDERGVYAHELSHAIDGGQGGAKISEGDEWQKAWDVELKGGGNGESGTSPGEAPLTVYAGSAPNEGFAEFGRLLYGTDVPTSQIEKDFPKCAEVFKANGLWPEERGGKVGVAEGATSGEGAPGGAVPSEGDKVTLGEVFDAEKRIDAGALGHADVLLGDKGTAKVDHDAMVDGMREMVQKSWYKKDLASDKFKSMSPEAQKELLDKAWAKDRKVFVKTAEAIHSKDPDLANNYTLNPKNKMLRKLFTQMTGVKLPDGVKASQQAVREWLASDKTSDSHAQSVKTVKDYADAYTKLYDASEHPDTTYDQMDELVDQFMNLSASQVHEIANQVNLLVPKNAPKSLVMEALLTRLKNRKGMYDRLNPKPEGGKPENTGNASQSVVESTPAGGGVPPQHAAAKGVNENVQLETASGAGATGGVRPGERVGNDAAAVPSGELPATDDATTGVGGPGRVRTGANERGNGPDVESVGPGDGAGSGERTGDGGALPASGERGAGDPSVRDAGGGRSGRVGDERPGTQESSQGVGGASEGETEAEPASQEKAPEDKNYRYQSGEFLASGKKGKFWDNVRAIQLLHQLDAEQRKPTEDERHILARYVGWGQFPAAFNKWGVSEDGENASEWSKERETLQNLLSPEDWQQAFESVGNAHYTHPDVVKTHWELLRKLGYKGGRYLEPSAGAGYYLGMMPEDLAAKTKATAVEKDATTAGILKHLYPESKVFHQPYEEHQAPDHFYDLAASNVPFGKWTLHEPRYNKFNAPIHDHFFLKSLDQVRPGGLVTHITSTGTMDKGSDMVRREIAKKADLVGAIRFPGGAHEKNAGTSVATDLLVFRKRREGELPHEDQSWLENTTVPDPAGGEPIPINKYFANHPEKVLGIVDRTGKMNQGNSPNVSKTADYHERLKKALESFPENVMSPRTAPPQRFSPEAMPAPGHVKDGGYHIDKSGKVFVRQGGGMIERKVPEQVAKRLGGMLGVRDARRALVNAELAGQDTTELRKKLNEAYDSFVEKHGYLSSKENRKAILGDPDAPVLLSLEKFETGTGRIGKMAIFSKQVTAPPKVVTSVDNPRDGVAASMNQFGRIDLGHIARLMGQPAKVVAEAMVAAGAAYENPSGGWEMGDVYLSGNVRKKLKEAEVAAKNDPKYAANVEALKKVQPQDVDPENISVKMGAPWIEPRDYAQFAAELIGEEPDKMSVHRLANGDWMFEVLTENKYNRKLHQDFRTPEVTFRELFEGALNGTTPTVNYKDANGVVKIDAELTQAAASKQQEIKDAFADWLWSDPERQTRLGRVYNDNFNNIRNMQWNGSHLTFPGKNPDMGIRPHVANFVWQVLTTGRGLGAHEVGMGKTRTMAAAAMELRRLGLAKKPAIVCMKANIEAITREALEMYPGAKILSTVGNFSAKQRKETVARIASGDYDMVIMTHDHFGMLPVSKKVHADYIQDEVHQLEAAAAAAQAEHGNDNRIVKRLNDQVQKAKANLAKALAAENKDDAVTFEESGIDHLFVDEAHKFKTLPTRSKMDVKGVPNGRSDRATDMHMKTQWLMNRNGGRGVVFMTGTPVSNTMAELYTMQKFLQPGDLKERGIDNFDAWANMFADAETKMEFTVSGEFKPVTRLRRFTNLADLMQMSWQVLDTQKIDDWKNEDGSPMIVRPERNMVPVVSPKTPEISVLMKELIDRAQAIKGRRSEPGADNMFKIGTDGRKGAIDMRLLDSEAGSDPDSKLNRCIENVLAKYKNKPGKTQLIFSDIGVNPVQSGFHLYKELIDRLVEGGVPREEIADFSKLDGEAKESAQQQMKAGKIRIGIGSTEKLGTGVNVQDHLEDLHHLDVPYVPASMEQRDGRGYRQGNNSKEIAIHRYVAEGSLDQALWQIISNKTAFINQVLKKGASVARTVANEEAGDDISPDQMIALASGDSRVMEKVQLEQDLKELEGKRRRHASEQSRLKQASGDLEKKDIPSHAVDLQRWKEVQKIVSGSPDFEMVIDGKRYTDRKEADEAYKAKTEAYDKNPRANKELYIGKVNGLDLYRDGLVTRLVGPHAEGKRYDAAVMYPGKTLASIERHVKEVPGQNIAKIQSSFDTKTRELADMQKRIGVPWKHEGDYLAKKERVKAIIDQLKGEGKDATGQAALDPLTHQGPIEHHHWEVSTRNGRNSKGGHALVRLRTFGPYTIENGDLYTSDGRLVHRTDSVSEAKELASMMHQAGLTPKLADKSKITAEDRDTWAKTLGKFEAEKDRREQEAIAKAKAAAELKAAADKAAKEAEAEANKKSEDD